MADLRDIRTDYALAGLSEGDVGDDPLVALDRWLGEAVAAGAVEPSAMVLATADADGSPSARTVLCKGLDGRGLVFFTNRTSKKGRDLAANPRCAAVFRWDALQRQATVRGAAVPVDDAASAAYFATRPRGSQVGAWASRQSAVVADRSVLEAQAAAVETRFGADLPLPPFWGGYLIVPDAVELWQGRPSRLHDRLRWRRTGPDGPWIRERLSP